MRGHPPGGKNQDRDMQYDGRNDSPVLRLFRRVALALCLAFPVAALSLIFFQLRSPYAGPDRTRSAGVLGNVEQSLRENLDRLAEGAEFSEGPEAREARIAGMTRVYEAAAAPLAGVVEGRRWAAMLIQAASLAAKPRPGASRDAVEMEMRAAGATVLGAIGQQMARLENPPYEAFEKQRRQFVIFCLAALAVILFPLAYLLIAEWRDYSDAQQPPPVTAAPWMEDAFQRLPEAVLVFDDTLHVRWANAAAERLLAYKPREMEGVPASTLFPGASGPAGALSPAAHSGPRRQTVRRANGEPFEASFQAVRAGARTMLLLRERTPEPAGALNPRLVDIEGLRQERDFFTAFLDSAPAPLLVFDREAHILHCNQAAAAMLGAPPVQFSGRPYWEALLEEPERELAARQWNELLVTKGRQQVFEHWRPGSPAALVVGCQRQTVLGKEGEVRHVVAALEPITPLAAAAGNGPSALLLQPSPNGSRDTLEDLLTEMIGYAELALMAMPEVLESRQDVERVRTAAQNAVGLWYRASGRGR